MRETRTTTIADSFQIAWDYLEATGELGRPDLAANHLLDTIEMMVRRGERRRLLLSNIAISAYSVGAYWTHLWPAGGYLAPPNKAFTGGVRML